MMTPEQLAEIRAIVETYTAAQQRIRSDIASRHIPNEDDEATRDDSRYYLAETASGLLAHIDDLTPEAESAAVLRRHLAQAMTLLSFGRELFKQSMQAPSTMSGPTWRELERKYIGDYNALDAEVRGCSDSTNQASTSQ